MSFQEFCSSLSTNLILSDSVSEIKKMKRSVDFMLNSSKNGIDDVLQMKISELKELEEDLVVTAEAIEKSNKLIGCLSSNIEKEKPNKSILEMLTMRKATVEAMMSYKFNIKDVEFRERIKKQLLALSSVTGLKTLMGSKENSGFYLYNERTGKSKCISLSQLQNIEPSQQSNYLWSCIGKLC